MTEGESRIAYLEQRARQADRYEARVGELRSALARFNSVLDDLDGKPAMINEGQTKAFNAKVAELARVTGQVRIELRGAMKQVASEHLGRPIESTNDLTYDEASWLIDYVQDQLDEANTGGS
jgi:hypothetical protein